MLHVWNFYKHSPVSCVGWKSYRLPRVVSSTLGGESQSYASASGVAEWCLLILAEALDSPFSLREIDEVLKRRAPIGITDCRSLYGHHHQQQHQHQHHHHHQQQQQQPQPQQQPQKDHLAWIVPWDASAGYGEVWRGRNCSPVLHEELKKPGDDLSRCWGTQWDGHFMSFLDSCDQRKR